MTSRYVGRPVFRLVGFLIPAAAFLIVLAIVFLREPVPPATSEGTDGTPAAAPVETMAAKPVQVLHPVRRDIARTLTLPANISPWYQATLYAKVPGYLKSISVDKGDHVKKGQLLAIIDAPEIQQQYEEAEAQHDIKRVTYERLSNVWKQNPDVIAKQDVDVAEAEAKAAKHLMERRRILLDYTRVIAPFTGIITGRFADPGALIQSASSSNTQAAPLLTIMDLDPVRVYISVPQEAAMFAQAGTPTLLQLAEMPGKEFREKITRTTNSLDPSTRTLLVEVDLPNPDEVLQPGMFATATLYLETHADAIALPSAAIFTVGGGTDRFVLAVENGKVRRAPIETGLDDGVWVEITSGLNGTEAVVVVGKGGLVDGDMVHASPYNLPVGKPARQKS